MKAKIKYQRIDSQNSRMVLRAGEKGTGKELFAVTYWPNSGISCEKADEHMYDYCRRHDIELVNDEEEGA